MDRLTGKTALIVGGASGIGLKIAERFAVEGASVIITGRRQNELDAAVAKLGTAGQGAVADAANPAQISALVANIGKQFGVLDILVINAGMSECSELETITEDHFDRTFGLRACFL
ncbi:SDR family NAD(P)-dependent oxidoreductase [Thalassospira mesophila]|uniref:SDR family NAD(P)-dependent oxidoreductase n=1 Tax=Thalassospira mesophila TaxID=1293891 RepID=UPI000A1DDC45|nr:SDR family NAD(P)-dependent oxidoreductase [Thalassospira mesophila]